MYWLICHIITCHLIHIYSNGLKPPILDFLSQVDLIINKLPDSPEALRDLEYAPGFFWWWSLQVDSARRGRVLGITSSWMISRSWERCLNAPLQTPREFRAPKMPKLSSKIVKLHDISSLAVDSQMNKIAAQCDVNQPLVKGLFRHNFGPCGRLYLWNSLRPCNRSSFRPFLWHYSLCTEMWESEMLHI